MQQLAPSPSLRGHPFHGLVSLWDMFEINGKEILSATSALSAIDAAVAARKEAGMSEGDATIGEKMSRRVESDLGVLSASCQAIDARVTRKLVEGLLAKVRRGKMTWHDFAEEGQNINRILRIEMGEAKLFAIHAPMIPYFENAIGLFSPKVAESFPSTLGDIDEAGKCFAFGRYSASIKHLMRVLEAPLQAVASLVVPDDPKPNWGPVLDKIEKELKKPYKERKIKGDVNFYASLSTYLHAIKDALRNPTSHFSTEVDAIATEQQARVVFAMTVQIMDRVATRLYQGGEILSEPSLPTEEDDPGSDT